MARLAFALALLLAVASGLVLNRGPLDPADSKTIDGKDCGNVKQIIGKWAHSKKVGQVSGEAKAAVMGTELAAKNAADMAARAKALGAKVGLKGEVPTGVKLAVEAAEKAVKAAEKAASTLSTATDTFSGKTADFAKKLSDADITKLVDLTEAAIVASEDATKAAERADAKADEAKEEAMKSTDGALKLINGLLADAEELTTAVGKFTYKTKNAVKDATALGKTSDSLAKKIDAQIKKAKEQAPVWTALKAELTNRAKATDTSNKEVKDALTALEKAAKDQDAKSKTLKDVKASALSSPRMLLGQSENMDKLEASSRAVDLALKALKAKVVSLIDDSDRLSEKIEDGEKKLKDGYVL